MGADGNNDAKEILDIQRTMSEANLKIKSQISRLEHNEAWRAMGYSKEYIYGLVDIQESIKMAQYMCGIALAAQYAKG